MNIKEYCDALNKYCTELEKENLQMARQLAKAYDAIVMACDMLSEIHNANIYYDFEKESYEVGL